MHSSSFILGCVVVIKIALAQTTDISASTVASDCNINGYASSCTTEASAPTDSLSDIITSTTTSATSAIETPYTPFNISTTNSTVTQPSNLSSMSTTLTSSVFPTNSSIPSYLNTSIITVDTHISIPTSILVATGTPTHGSGGIVGGLTVTSFAYVTASATGAGSSKTSITPTQASIASMRKGAGLSGLLCFALGVSGLLLA